MSGETDRNMLPTTILVLDAAPAGVAVRARASLLTLVGADVEWHADREETGHEGISRLPLIAAECLRTEEGQRIRAGHGLIAVVTGPGSFTGLRTACALAEGLGLGTGCPVAGVSRGEALGRRLSARLRDENLAGWLWFGQARRGRWFMEGATTDGVKLPVRAVEIEGWVPPAGQWLLAGDAAHEAAGQMNGAVCLSDAIEAKPEEIARVALAHLLADDLPRPVLPLYVDPPEAKLPAAGLRPAPV